MKRSVFGACVVAVVALSGLPATSVLAAEVVPGTTLPDSSTLVGFGAAESVAKARSALTTTRINLEPDEGAWRYRVEGFGVRGQRIRVDVLATTGDVIRVRNEGGGGRLSREAAAIRAAVNSFTVSFAQAADIAATANAGFFVHDVRLELRNGTLVYKVQLVNATASREVRLNPVGGAIISTQAGDDTGGGTGDAPNHDQNDDHGGAAGNSGNAGGSNTGGSNSGNSGSSNSGNSGSGNSGNTPQTGNIPNQPRAVAAALAAALAGGPSGTQLVESRYVRIRNQMQFEAITLAPGNIGTRTRFDLRTGNIAGVSGEQVGSDDLARLAAFQAALGGAASITPDAAVTSAWNANRGDVLRVEPSVQRTTPVYEVRMLLGNRERTIKVHAVTGTVVN